MLALISHIFNPTVELVIPTGILTKAEIENIQQQQKLEEDNVRNNLNNYMSFYAFCSSKI